MRKLFYLIICLGILTISSTAIAWDFSKYSSTSQNSTFAISKYSSISYSNAGATASAMSFGCGTCITLNTYAITSSYAASGSNWFSASATAYAEAESYPNFNCNEPPVCEDGDDDGVCDESDNCEFIPNTDQADADDDQIGDACDVCPNDPDDLCNEPPPPCEDTDQDLICDEDDPCPDDYNNTCNDPEPECDLTCQLAEACPCDNDWVNHGAYVVCVNTFERDHRGEPGIGDVVNLAGNSDCGGSHVGTPN